MGEEKADQKQKVDVKKVQAHWTTNRKQQRVARPKKQEFRAQTAGLETAIFTVGTAKDAANFIEVMKQLSRWAGVNFRNGGAMAQAAIEDMIEPKIDPPEDLPATGATKKEEKKWELDFEKYYKKTAAWEEAEGKAFQLILAHCHPDVERRVTASSKWETIKTSGKLIPLLELVRQVCHKHDEVKQGTMALVEQQMQLFLNYQRQDITLEDFVKQFRARAEVINTFGGRAGYHPKLYQQHCQAMAAKLDKAVDALTDAEKEDCLKASCEEFLAALLIRISNDTFYKAAKTSLANGNLSNKDIYPKTLDEARRYLENYQGEPTVRPPRAERIDDGVAFVQAGQKSKYNTGNPKEDPCYSCGKKGHIAKNCPELNAKERKEVELVGVVEFNAITDAGLQECIEGVANVIMGMDDASIETAEDEDDVVEDGAFNAVGFIELSSGKARKVDCGRSRLYLDSCATENVMFAVENLTKCHTTGVTMRQNCNAGTKLTNRMGYWGGIKFWISPDGIANLLSIPKLQEAGFKIQFTDKWRMLTPNNKLITFAQDDAGVCKGMPYINLDRIDDFCEEVEDAPTFIESVRKNYEGFTAEQVKRAREARDALAMMAHPRGDRLAHMVSSNVIENCKVRSSDLANATVIYGPDRGAIRGKTVRRKPEKVRPEYSRIPLQLFERLKDVTLSADIMFVNGLPFFVTLSRAIKMGTAEFTPSRTADALHKKLETVKRLYCRGGFLVRTVLMDMEFEPLVDLSTDANINCTAAREHVGDIERFIRTVRERMRSTASELPYSDYMPDAFIIRLVYFAVMWINAFLAENGASQEYSPREIVTGLKMDFQKHCRARWGSYVEASVDDIVTNTQVNRTHPSICLGPTGNMQGSVWCYDLKTKKVVKRRTITPLPMPDCVIRRVVELGKQSKQKRTSDRLQFLNRNKECFA